MSNVESLNVEQQRNLLNHGEHREHGENLSEKKQTNSTSSSCHSRGNGNPLNLLQIPTFPDRSGQAVGMTRNENLIFQKSLYSKFYELKGVRK